MVNPRPDRHEPDAPPPLPFRIGPVTNGEFVPTSRTRADVAVERAILDVADDAARRNNMDRRKFLQTAGGVAAALAVVSACSSGGGSARRAERRATTTVPTTGGGFTVPPPEDVEACEQELGNQGEFIFDVHTHHVMPHGAWRQS